MSEIFKKYKSEIIIVSLAFILRLVFFIAYLVKFGDGGLAYGDSTQYLKLVDNLFAYGKFSLFDAAPFHPDGYFTPGYPFLLTFFRFFTDKLWPVGLLQVFLGSLTALFIYRLGGLWAKRIGFVAAIIFALEPTTAFWTPVILTETLFTFLLVLSFYLVFSALKNGSMKKYLFGAFVLGVDALVRPSAQYVFYLLVVFGIIWVISKDWKKRLLYLLAFAVIFNATIAPWLIRNYQIWGRAKLSSAGWYILEAVNTNEYLKFWKYFPPDKPIEIPPLTESCRAQGEYIWWNFDCVDQNKAHVMAFLHANPKAVIAVHFMGLIPFFMGSGFTNILRGLVPEIKPPAVLFGQRNLAGIFNTAFALRGIYGVVFWAGIIIWLIIYVFMLYGIICSLKDRNLRNYILFFLAVIFVFALPAGAIAYARYRLPADFIIFIITAFGVDFVLKKYESRSRG